MEEIIAAVKQDLAQMKRLDILVPKSADAYVDAHKAELCDYRRCGMKISEIADLVTQLC